MALRLGASVCARLKTNRVLQWAQGAEKKWFLCCDSGRVGLKPRPPCPFPSPEACLGSNDGGGACRFLQPVCMCLFVCSLAALLTGTTSRRVRYAQAKETQLRANGRGHAHTFERGSGKSPEPFFFPPLPAKALQMEQLRRRASGTAFVLPYFILSVGRLLHRRSAILHHAISFTRPLPRLTVASQDSHAENHHGFFSLP